jgi:hypothetical protein
VTNKIRFVCATREPKGSFFSRTALGQSLAPFCEHPENSWVEVVIGNKRRVPNQPAWCFIDDQFTADSMENMTGAIGHGKNFPADKLSLLGAPGQPVKLLDGVLLAARSETLLARGLWFDERFDFHFYDMDFCRQAEAHQLRMGTWWISVIHASQGAFGSPAWRQGYAKYLEKWRS